MWLRRKGGLALPERLEASAPTQEQLAVALLRYCADQLSTTTKAPIRSRVERFAALSPTQQRHELPALYLQLESLLADQLGGVPRARSELRRIIDLRFRPLLDVPDFALIFAAPTQQEFWLCKTLLTDIIGYALDLLGSAGRGRLEQLLRWVEATPAASLPVPLVTVQRLPRNDSELVTLFFQLGRELYAYLERSLGAQCARSFYERGYQEVADRYLALDSFPVLVNILPEHLIDSGKIDRLSRGQIQRVLLQKVMDLDGANVDLRLNLEELSKAKENLARAHDELELRVQERTAALSEANRQLQNEVAERQQAEAELRTAMEAATAASRAKSEFLANMSHELRTPLNAIIGFSDVILAETFGAIGDSHYSQYVEDIRNSGAHLLSLINDVLDLAKAEAGKFDLVEESAAHLSDIIDQAMRFVGIQALKGGITLKHAVDKDLPPVIISKQRIVQAVVNLLSNAVKFTKPGGSVKVEAKCTADGQLVVSVEDTGIGIAPTDLERIFDPFEQGETGYSRNYQGTGLGLSLAKKLVELHGGTLSIVSEIGRGTIARITLPASRVQSGARYARLDGSASDQAAPLMELGS